VGQLVKSLITDVECTHFKTVHVRYFPKVFLLTNKCTPDAFGSGEDKGGEEDETYTGVVGAN